MSFTKRFHHDIIRKIGTDPNLKLRDIYHLCLTNKRLSNVLCSDPVFWRLRYKTDFGKDLPREVNITSAKMYGQILQIANCKQTECLKNLFINDPEGYLTLKHLFGWSILKDRKYFESLPSQRKIRIAAIKMGIEKALKKDVPEIKEVIAL